MIDDDLLARECGEGLEVIRAHTYEPSYKLKKAVWASDADKRAPELKDLVKGAMVSTVKSFLFPDPQVLWLPHAIAKLTSRVLEKKDDVIFISAPPFSQFLMAPFQKLNKKQALVLDYRDEWIMYRNTYEMMGKLGALLGGPVEKVLVHKADMITTATESFRENLIEQFPSLDPTKVVAIPNGYDPMDLPELNTEPPTDKFTITYAGTVFKLTRPGAFLNAIRWVAERSPELIPYLRVNFYGRIVDTERYLFEGLERLGVEQHGMVDKPTVMKAQKASHMVLCSLDDVPGNERIYPGKIFELMLLKRPVLVLAPEGALSKLCKKHNLGSAFLPDDTGAIADFLEAKIKEFKSGTYVKEQPVQNIEKFHRKEQAGEFKAVFEEALARRTKV